VAGPPRLPIAVRAAVSTAVPVLAGSILGDVGAGLIASIGAFTSRFGIGRPYLNRGIQLAVVAVTLAASVAVGAWAATIAWVGVVAVSAIAVLAVWLCNALAVGPPGAYVFVVACAAGIGVSASHLSPLHVGLLVLAGGAVALIAQMIGATTDFRRPERAAVSAAANAVAEFIEKADTAEQAAARHRAATALHLAWSNLINYQPVGVRAGSVLLRLRAANHAIHIAFADAMTATAAGGRPDEGSAELVRKLGALDAAPELATARDVDRLPLGRPAVSSLLRQAVAPRSQTRRVMLRVAIGVPIAGACASMLGVDRAYWAMAAAVLVLHQGASLVHTLRRGGERLLGTWIGLGLAAVILLTHPTGWALAVVLALLQFAIEMLVTRNYTLATVFITATALTIASGTRVIDVGHLLLSRGVDTMIGCAVGIAVYLVIAPRQEATRVSDALQGVRDANAVASAYLCDGDATSLPARTSRRDLQRATLDMLDAHDAAEQGTREQRAAAAALWPDVVDTEHDAYQTIARFWEMERR
jgi:fusaric acid resistance family protein